MEPSDNASAKGKRIKVQPVISVSKKFDAEELLSQVCYNYPQYNLDQAARLSYRQVRLLLRTARREQAIQMYNLTQVVAAPHTEKGKGVAKLTEYFEKIANS